MIAYKSILGLTVLILVSISNAEEVTFSGITGEWQPLCTGCNEQEFTIKYGFKDTNDKSTAVVNKKELSASMEASFDALFASGSVSVSGSIAQDIANEMQSSMEVEKEAEEKYTCDKGYFYQWIMSGDISTGDKEFTLGSVQTLCTSSSATPSCVPGYCDVNGQLIHSQNVVYSWYNAKKNYYYLSTNGLKLDTKIGDYGDWKKVNYGMAGAVFKVYEIQQPGYIPLYLKTCVSPTCYGDQLLTTRKDEASAIYFYSGVLGYCNPWPIQGSDQPYSKKLIRYFNGVGHVVHPNIEDDFVKRLKETGYIVDGAIPCYVDTNLA